MPRRPYVFDPDDEVAARRSAAIDLEESDTYPLGSDEWLRCMSSAESWLAQAELIADALGTNRRPIPAPLFLVCPCGALRRPAEPCAVCGQLLPTHERVITDG
jgi:hypothetical protein